MGLRFTNLVSYALLKDKAMLCTHPEWDTMLDSGGFTNFVTGKVHSEIKEYIYFLRTHGHHFWNYFALDKIGNPKVSEQYYKQMVDKGLSPIPIFQRGGGTKQQLMDLLKAYEIVAIGGISQALSAKVEQQYISNVMSVARRVPKQKVHLLGVGVREARRYNPYSADSSTWASHGRYGILYLWHRGKIQIYQKHQRGQKSKNYVKPNPNMTRVLYSYGLTWDHLMDEDNWRSNHSKLALAVGRSWLRQCFALRKKGCRYVLAHVLPTGATLKEAWEYERRMWGWEPRTRFFPVQTDLANERAKERAKKKKEAKKQNK